MRIPAIASLSALVLSSPALAGAPEVVPFGESYGGPTHCSDERVRYACELTDGRVVSICGDHPAHLTARVGKPGQAAELSGGNHGSLSSRSGMGFRTSDPERSEVVFYADVGSVAAFATGDGGGLRIENGGSPETTVACTTAPRTDFWMLDLLPSSPLPPGGAKADDGVVPAPVPEAEGTLCLPHETPNFSCTLTNGKQVALCAGRHYRFGEPGAVELDFLTPSYRGGGPAGVNQWIVEGETRTSFYTERPWRYELYSTATDGGVRVFADDEKKAELRCRSAPNTRYESLDGGSGPTNPPWYSGPPGTPPP